MTEKYSQWITVKLRHEYWNVTEPGLFAFQAAEETREVFRRYQVLERTVTNSLILQADPSIQERMPQGTTLNFKVILLDPTLKNYSDIPDFRDDHALHFDVGDEVSIDVLPLRRTLSGLFAGDQPVTDLIDATGSRLTQELLRGKTDPAFDRHINAFQEGMYRTDPLDERFIYERERTKNLFGWITIHCDTALPETTVTLPSRSVKLTYRVSSEQYDLDTLRLEERNGDVTFSSEIEGTQATFESDQFIKWQQRPTQHFRIMNGRSRPIVESVPIEENKNLKFNKELEPFLEIFIHV